MKILAEIAAVAILAPLIATAQDVARDIARQMGADTTTSISPGLDRHDIHRDTETVERSRQHVPNLLQSAQGSTAKNPSKTQKKNPPRPRNTFAYPAKCHLSNSCCNSAKGERQHICLVYDNQRSNGIVYGSRRGKHRRRSDES